MRKNLVEWSLSMKITLKDLFENFQKQIPLRQIYVKCLEKNRRYSL